VVDVGRVGVWSPAFRFGHPSAVAEAASELEELGYDALWYPAFGEGALDVAGNMLEATDRLTVVTGIRSVWADTAERTAADHAAISAAHPGRFLLGLGVSHAPVVEMEAPDRTYQRPLEAMERFLDGLDGAAPPLPRDERMLAALGPKMLALARDRSVGACPYLVTPEHTARAREVLGEGPVLAPEQAVIVETDAGAAREAARRHLAIYLELPNYVNNLHRVGFGDAELAGGGSDRLVHALVTCGDVDAVAERVREHRDAGADHVAIQVVVDDRSGGLPMAQWRALAEALVD